MHKIEITEKDKGAWEERMKQQSKEFPSGHPFYTPPPPPLKLHQRILLKIKWFFGLRITHKDRIDYD